MGKREPKRTRFQKARELWVQRVTKTLLELGAVPTSGMWSQMYPLTVNTQAGPLLLNVSPSIDPATWQRSGRRNESVGGSVFGRFLDVDKAKQFFGVDRLGNHAGLNVYSGKWNHHYFDWSATCTCRDIKSEIERVRAS